MISKVLIERFQYKISLSLGSVRPKTNYYSYSTSSLNSNKKTAQTKSKKAQLYSFGKYAYYDAVVDISHLNVVRTDAYYIARQRFRLENKDAPPPPQSLVFDPSAKKGGPTFDQVFGGASKTATKSSRRDLSYRNKNKIIAGIKVPGRPIEPDNCCMSGCVNCVWELFNEDLEEWKDKRNEVAKKLNSQAENGGLGPNGETLVWPHNWEIPPKTLNPKFLSSEYKAKLASSKDKSATNPDGVEEIQGMPVGLQVFAMFEKKKKEERKKKEAKRRAETISSSSSAKSSSSSSTASIENSRNTSATLQ